MPGFEPGTLKITTGGHPSKYWLGSMLLNFSVRSLKLSSVEPSQYLDGWPPLVIFRVPGSTPRPGISKKLPSILDFKLCTANVYIYSTTPVQIQSCQRYKWYLHTPNSSAGYSYYCPKIQPAISIQLAVVHSTANRGRNCIVLQKMYSFYACAIIKMAHAQKLYIFCSTM